MPSNQFFSNQVLEYMCSTEDSPALLPDFISAEEIILILNEAKHFSSHRIDGSTGTGIAKFWTKSLAKVLLPKFSSILPDMEPALCRLRNRKSGLSPHVDSPIDPDAFSSKALLIPLSILPTDRVDHMVFFDQRWYGTCAMMDSEGKWVGQFFDGQMLRPTPQRKEQIAKYGFDGDSAENYLDSYLEHLTKKHVEGLTVQSLISIRPGSAVLFDRHQLHSSQSFSFTGITERISLQVTFVKRGSNKGVHMNFYGAPKLESL